MRILLKSPAFWHKHSWISKILSPLGYLYGFGVYLRHALTKPHKLQIPTICVGNLVLGGAGKTPTVVALIELLKQRGHNPHVLTRGYGRRSAHLCRVDPKKHTYHEVGDEPLLLAQFAPTWVTTNRVEAGERAFAEGATILLMDDGYQNPDLFKDCHLLVFDGDQRIGNGHLFPAGPLREFPDHALKRADGVVIIGDHTRSLPPYHGPVFHAQFVPQAPFPTEGVVAFTGLGYPKKFHKTLEKLGIPIHNFITFPDHHPYSLKDMEKLTHYVYPLVTTEKDWVRIPPSYRDQVMVLKGKLEFADAEAILNLVEKYI